MNHIDSTVDEVRSILQAAKNKIMQRISKLSGTELDIQTAILNDIDRELSGAIEQAVSGSISPVVQLRNSEIAGASDVAGLSKEAIEQLVDSVKQNLLAVKDIAISEQAAVLTAQLTGQEVTSDLIGSMAESLDASISQAMSVLDTNLAAIDRKTSIDAAAQLGLDVLVYTGPMDGVTRDFCAQTLMGSSDGLPRGHYYLDDVNDMENYVGPQPASLFGGGWRCRHQWTGVELA